MTVTLLLPFRWFLRRVLGQKVVGSLISGSDPFLPLFCLSILFKCETKVFLQCLLELF